MNGDSARVSVAVAVPPSLAFELFTHDIDRWWRRGVAYRHAGTSSGIICIEGRLDGRLFESFERGAEPQVFEVGRVRIWDPPRRLAFTWRNSNFSADEQTMVEVEFSATRSGTLVTVTHSALATLRADHPARHGLPPGEYVRLIGMWWGEQLTSLREHCSSRDS